MGETFQAPAHNKVMHRLEEKGFEAFFVGGYVRDRILGRHSKDVDITTNALPEQVRAIFNHTVPVGAKFGVVVVVMDGVQVEVATYRTDGVYTDGRRPETVAYGKTAREDVMRRDFTMNGLLLKSDYSVFDENGIIDYVGGEKDIKQRTIRCIGDANVRFAEDALRMLRAVRFAAQLNFKIAPETLAAIEQNAALLRVISAERIAAELFKIFTSPHPLKGLVPFFATGLGRYALPASYINSSLFIYTMQRFKQFAAEKDSMLGMAMFLADAPADQTLKMALHLNLSNVDRERLVNARLIHLPTLQATLRGEYVPLARMKRMARRPGLDLALELFIQDEIIHKSSFGVEAVMNLVKTYQAFKPEDINPASLVTGQDLIAMGMTPGPIFTEIMDNIETRQLNDPTFSREEALRIIKERCWKDNETGEAVCDFKGSK
jgi:poly(A) polymerase